MSYQNISPTSHEAVKQPLPSDGGGHRRINLRTKVALIGLPLTIVPPTAVAIAADHAPQTPPVEQCENVGLIGSDTQLAKLIDKPAYACLGEQAVSLSLGNSDSAKPQPNNDDHFVESGKNDKRVRQCDTFYFDTKVRYTASEYRNLRKIVAGDRPEGWTKAKYAQARSLPLSPTENCADREKLLELNNFEARLRKQHPKEILSVLGEKQGWSDYEIASAAAIIEGGMGVPANKAENPTWNECRKQGQTPSITCEEAVALGHPSTQIGYGLGQATPGDKMEPYGEDWETNPVTQIKWYIQYLTQRHNGPVLALRYKIINGHY